MTRYYIGLLICLGAFVDITEAQELSYVDIYHPIAVREMHHYGIPASITLAQGILESGRGKSSLATEGNNHFGIKCHKGWEGPSMYLDDDAPDECFRVYADAESSYKDHSLFLTTRSRYDTLFTFDGKDYTAWAHGLSACGYATNPKYPELLISIIESANLQRFDDFDLGQYEVEGPYSDLAALTNRDHSSNPTNELPSETNFSYPDLREQDGVFLQNRIQAVAYRGEALDSLAVLLDLSILQLSKYNDLLAGESIPLGSPVYRQPKKKKGVEETVVVRADDNMWLISQWQGIRLTRLYMLNNMIPGEEPAVGEVLHLRKPSETKPALRDKTEDKAEITPTIEVVGAQDDIEIGIEAEIIPATDEVQEMGEPVEAGSIDEDSTTAHSKEMSPDSVSVVATDSVQRTDREISLSDEHSSVLPDPMESEENAAADVVIPDVNISSEEGVSNSDLNPTPVETEPLMDESLNESPGTPEIEERSFHIVAEGETLFSIARLYDLTLMNLKQWNALEGVTIAVGQKLFVEPR
ncbi:MAG: glucosaminidase domain-containing protein [Chitinophagales bacterium]